jgi:hypothetical protein
MQKQRKYDLYYAYRDHRRYVTEEKYSKSYNEAFEKQNTGVFLLNLWLI